MEYKEQVRHEWTQNGLRVKYDPSVEHDPCDGEGGDEPQPVEILFVEHNGTESFDDTMFLTMDQLRSLITMLTSVEAIASRHAHGRP